MALLIAKALQKRLPSAIVTKQSLRSQSSQSSIEEAFGTHKIVPAVLPRAPAKLLKITYGDVAVNLGNKIPARSVRGEPKIEWDADPNSFYTLIFLDPDAPSPSRPFMGEMIHHMVINIKGQNVASGSVASAYKGSAPPPRTGTHRYIYLLLKQAGEITDYTLKSKSKFKTVDFCSKYNCTVEAGNFFLAAFDSSVLGTWCRYFFS